MTARLFIEIPNKRGTTLYLIEPLTTDPRVAVKAFRLWKGNMKTFYDVAIEHYGPTCTCPDAEWRRKACKHMHALRDVGLLPRQK